jgi:hypothetical protein
MPEVYPAESPATSAFLEGAAVGNPAISVNGRREPADSRSECGISVRRVADNLPAGFGGIPLP